MASSSFDTGSFAVPDRVPRLALDPRPRPQPAMYRRQRSEALIALLLVAALAVAIVATTTGQTSLGAVRTAVRTRATQHAAARAWPRAPGDAQLGGGHRAEQRARNAAGWVAGSLAPVASVLRSGDGTIGNLEGTLSVGGGSKCGADDGGTCFAFQAPPAVAGELRSVGFKLVNQANNHSLDFGEAGRAQTLAALHRASLPYTGLPGQITTLSLHGTRVAFVGFAPYRYTASLLDIPTARALVRTARRHARLVVVMIHAGAEGSTATHVPVGDETFLGEDRGDARAFAHAVIDAGAAAVIGSGPHVVRGIENYHGHLVAYSVGNFVGYNTLGHGGVLSAAGILHFTIAPDGRLRSGRWISVALVDGLPRLDHSNSVAQFVSELSAADFPDDHFTLPQTAGFTAETRPARSAVDREVERDPRAGRLAVRREPRRRRIEPKVDLGVFVGHDIELALIIRYVGDRPPHLGAEVQDRHPGAHGWLATRGHVPESAASGSADEDRRVGGDRDGGGALGLGDPTRLRCSGEATIARQLLTADRHDA